MKTLTSRYVFSKSTKSSRFLMIIDRNSKSCSCFVSEINSEILIQVWDPDFGFHVIDFYPLSQAFLAARHPAA